MSSLSPPRTPDTEISAPALEVLAAGPGASFQDQGRLGWRRFGIPPGGAMDDHAAGWANRLLLNPPPAPVLELLWEGARFAVLQECWIAVTGADASATVPTWRAVKVQRGETLDFPQNRSGLWSYVAIEGGFFAPEVLGSGSAYPLANFGVQCKPGQVLHRRLNGSFELPPGVTGRFTSWKERRAYASPPNLRVWPAPQWASFNKKDQDAFFKQEWTVSPDSNRVGYRLTGEPLTPPSAPLLSEPVRVGTIQIPGNGQPIVTMRDGPTVGGYPKLGMVDPADISWLAQSKPGQKVRFQLLNEAGLEL